MIARMTLDALRARDATCYYAQMPAWVTPAGNTVAKVTEFFVDRIGALKRATQWDSVAPLAAPPSIVQPIKARAISRESQTSKPGGRLARALRRLPLLG
jgi:hypothetical protein